MLPVLQLLFPLPLLKSPAVTWGPIEGVGGRIEGIVRRQQVPFHHHACLYICHFYCPQLIPRNLTTSNTPPIHSFISPKRRNEAGEVSCGKPEDKRNDLLLRDHHNGPRRHRPPPAAYHQQSGIDMNLPPSALLRDGGSEALWALGSSLGNHFANTTRRGQEIADVVEQSLRSSSPMRSLVSQVGTEWVTSNRSRRNESKEEGDPVVEAAAAVLVDDLKTVSTRDATAVWVTTEVAAVRTKLDAFLFACLRCTGSGLEEMGELLARCLSEVEEEELGRGKLVYASGSWEAILRAWLRLELLRATDTSIDSQQERQNRFQVLCAMVVKGELVATCHGTLVLVEEVHGEEGNVRILLGIPYSTLTNFLSTNYADIQNLRKVLCRVQNCLDRLAALASTDRTVSVICLPLDLPLPQSLPICLFSSDSSYDRQLAAASEFAAKQIASEVSTAGAAATATATIVGMTSTIEVRGAGLEQGKSH